jgi:hypothetical protein
MSFFKMLEKIDLHNKDSYKPQDEVGIRDEFRRGVGLLR